MPETARPRGPSGLSDSVVTSNQGLAQTAGIPCVRCEHVAPACSGHGSPSMRTGSPAFAGRHRNPCPCIYLAQLYTDSLCIQPTGLTLARSPGPVKALLYKTNTADRHSFVCPSARRAAAPPHGASPGAPHARGMAVCRATAESANARRPLSGRAGPAPGAGSVGPGDYAAAARSPPGAGPGVMTGSPGGCWHARDPHPLPSPGPALTPAAASDILPPTALSPRPITGGSTSSRRIQRSPASRGSRRRAAH